MDARKRGTRQSWSAGSENVAGSRSFNGLSPLFCQNLIQQGKIVEPGEIRHLTAEESVVEGLFRRCVQCFMQRIVGRLHARKCFVENIQGKSFAGLALDLFVQELL